MRDQKETNPSIFFLLLLFLIFCFFWKYDFQDSYDLVHNLWILFHFTFCLKHSFSIRLESFSILGSWLDVDLKVKWVCRATKFVSSLKWFFDNNFTITCFFEAFTSSKWTGQLTFMQLNFWTSSKKHIFPCSFHHTFIFFFRKK